MYTRRKHRHGGTYTEGLTHGGGIYTEGYTYGGDIYNGRTNLQNDQDMERTRTQREHTHGGHTQRGYAHGRTCIRWDIHSVEMSETEWKYEDVS